MDILRFTNPTHPALMEQAEVVEGLKSKMWIERYQEPGEFKFTAKAGAHIMKQLPLGAFVSHTDTQELMVVENHEISQSRGSEPEIVISGRSFETFLENRVVGSNMTGVVTPTTEARTYANLPAYITAGNLINSYVLVNTNTADRLPHFNRRVVLSTQPAEAAERVIKAGNLYDRVIELLKVEDFGIRVVRPIYGSELTGVVRRSYFIIHSGKDRSEEISFSYAEGEIENADYLWSTKKVKNSAMVRSRWFQLRVTTGYTGLSRKMVYVEASDIDSDLNVAPTGSARTRVINQMVQRAHEAMAEQNKVTIIKAEAARSGVAPRYRRDYDIGDLVSVYGNYNAGAKMRVTEYVEIEDDNGAHSYPTFSYMSAINPYRAIIGQDRPVGYWPLNETLGTQARDASGNGYHGTYGPVTLGVEGPTPDPAVNFNGLDSRVLVSYREAINPAPSFSAEAWVRRVGGIGPYRTVLRATRDGTGHMIRMQADGRLAGYANLGTGWSIVDGPIPPLSEWIHIVHVMGGLVPGGDDGSGRYQHLYVNGQVVDSKYALFFNAPYNPNRVLPLYFGAGTDAGNDYWWQGDIAQVAIYDYALTSTQVMRHYEAALSSFD